jgi:cysteine dioxygenase
MSAEKESLEFISSLDELISALKSGHYQEALNQSYDLNISHSEIEHYTTWNDSRYTRNCIARNEDFELILLCWEEGQKTAIHCHNQQECWVKVIQGNFAEYLYEYDDVLNRMNPINEVHVGQNEVTTIENSNTYHSLENTYKGRSVSLHLYMKPIVKCNVYNQTTNQLECKTLTYDTFEGEVFINS